jgi:hypothetical protein
MVTGRGPRGEECTGKSTALLLHRVRHTQLGNSNTTVSQINVIVRFVVAHVSSSSFLCLRFIINMASKAVLASEVLASELEDYVWVERECKLLQATHTAESLLDALTRQKRRGTSAWWKQFTPIKVELVDREQKQRWWAVRLQCNECEAHLL